jgi:ribosomal protein L35AE/L33A
LASTLVGVGRASGDLLWGKVEEHSGRYGSVRLNSSSASECPA